MPQPGTLVEYSNAILSKESVTGGADGLRQLKLQQSIALLPPVTLKEMDKVRLMNRIDLKYLVADEAIPSIIKKLSEDYHIQEIDGNRMAEYETEYLDTSDLTFFLTHINGKLNRFKWRIRKYVDSNLSFLEIKIKSNKGRTDKKRILLSPFNGLNDRVVAEFIDQNSDIEAKKLYPVLQNKFSRLTLVNAGKTERLTIDLNISFQNCLNGKSFTVDNLAIIELKQDKTLNSSAAGLFDQMRIRKIGLSKYCLGMVLTSDQVKGNLYKQKIRQISKILHQQ
jgi:hypothetical protein